MLKQTLELFMIQKQQGRTASRVFLVYIFSYYMFLKLLISPKALQQGPTVLTNLEYKTWLVCDAICIFLINQVLQHDINAK